MAGMAKILLTGFSAFAGSKENPTQKLVEKIAQQAEYKELVETLVLPVSFKKAPELIIERIEEQGPYPIVLMLGLAAGRSKVSLERVALNWVETTQADEDKALPPTGRLQEMGIEAYFCYAPLEKIKEALEKNKISTEISLSAGAFVCNATYYSVLDFFAESDEHALFVHFPSTSEMPLAEMEKALKVIMQELLQWRA